MKATLLLLICLGVGALRVVRVRRSAWGREEALGASTQANGAVFIRSHRAEYLEDRDGRVGVHTDQGSFQTWRIEPSGDGRSVFIRGHRGQNLEDRDGRVGVHADQGAFQQWRIESSGDGELVFLRSHRGQYLEDRDGKVGVSTDKGGYQKWRIVQEQEGRWRTRADGSNGPCSDIVKRDLGGTLQQGDLPVGLPLLCSGAATDVILTASAFGHSGANMRLRVDGVDRASLKYHLFPWGQWKTMRVVLSSLSQGAHTLWLEGSRIDLKEVILDGDGASCSLTDAPGYDQSQGNYLYRGLDSMHRLFNTGGDTDFPANRKKQLYFSSESLGTSADKSISSTVVANGMWQWMLEYSQNSTAADPWGGGPERLWKEAKITPWRKAQIGRVPNMRSDASIEVVESCNALSNIAFHQAANWLACKGYDHMTRDEYASVITGFNGLAPGSMFFHACACRVGGRADTLPMDWFLLQVYQIMVRGAVSQAGGQLTEQEQDTIRFLGNPSRPQALNISRQFTMLFSQKYDSKIWEETIRGMVVPGFDKAVAGIVGFMTWGVQGFLPIPGLKPLLESLLGEIIGVLNPGDKDWFMNTYTPTVQKLWRSVKVCPGSRTKVLTKLLAFAVTFVEALVFQEQQLPVPPVIRQIMDTFSSIGLDSSLLNDMYGDWDMYNSFDCYGRSDHAKWHAVAAQGLVHISQAADIMVGNTKATC